MKCASLAILLGRSAVAAEVGARRGVGLAEEDVGAGLAEEDVGAGLEEEGVGVGGVRDARVFWSAVNCVVRRSSFCMRYWFSSDRDWFSRSR